jgi:hypothetical protein
MMLGGYVSEKLKGYGVHVSDKNCSTEYYYRLILLAKMLIFLRYAAFVN